MQTTTNRAMAALLAVGLGSGLLAQESGAAKAALDSLVADYNTARSEYSSKIRQVTQTDEYKAAVAAKDQEAANKLRAGVARIDTAQWAQRAMHVAAQFDGDARLPFYTWLLLNTGDKPCSEKVIAEVRAHHMQSPLLTDILEKGYILGRILGEDGEVFLDEVVAQSPHDLAKAWAIYWKAYPTTRNKEASDEAQAAAQAMLQQAATLAAGTLLEDRIRAPQFQAERLQIGMTVPEVEGVDTDGVAFKLSDYRGKVVVLDFWGFW